MSKKNQTPDTFSLEEELQELRSIMDKMQGSNMDFDQNIKLFTTGSEKIKACRNYLNEAEMMIKRLIEGENGWEEVDFE